MALTHFAFSRLGNFGTGYVEGTPVDEDVVSAGIAPTGSNQQTSITAPAIGERCVARVATDTAVYVAFGTSPDASTAAARWFCPANTVSFFSVAPGDKGAVIT